MFFRYQMSGAVCLVFIFGFCMFSGCRDQGRTGGEHTGQSRGDTVSPAQVPAYEPITAKPDHIALPPGMVWIPGGRMTQGAGGNDSYAMAHEKPAHGVAVDGFFMDAHEVTNAQFARFVEATGYVTVAERPLVWEELRKQLPAGTERPHDSVMKPGSLVFRETGGTVPNLYDYSQWWKWQVGANWKHPNGPGSSLEGRENDPVVQVAFEDAMAYCAWAGRRLPTEAEWEYACRGGREGTIFFWGSDPDLLSEHANTWNGEFPVANTMEDGFDRRAPVGSYPPNTYGLYDMAGNVWEWTSDWYHSNYYGTLAGSAFTINPEGPEEPFNAGNPYAREKVIKGGSFLCNASYCASYRASARMASSTDSSLEHLGFRTVATVAMLSKEENP